MKHMPWLEQVTNENYTIEVQEGVDRERPESNSDVGRLWNRMHPPGILRQLYGATGGMEDADAQEELKPQVEESPLPFITLTDQ